ncbi:MAG: hypothetical protein LC749_00750 [Actinobacteria bacterium]|nr:hypothetical protein [Actinomycetota bacterium]
MGYEEQLQRSAGTDGVPPQRSANWLERRTEGRGVGRLTPRLVVLAVTVISIGAAGGLVWPKTYGARAEILYPIGQDQGGDPLRLDRQLSTQLVLLKSRAVLGPIAQKQGQQFEDLDNDVSVQVLDNSEVIQVETHRSTELAATQTLQAIIDRYLTLAGQPSGVARNLDTQLATTRQNTAQLQTRVQQLRTAVLAGTATQASLNDTRAQLTASLDRDKAIQVRIDEIRLAGQDGPHAQLLTPPYSLPDPMFPQPLITAGTGAMAGLIMAGAVVAVGVWRRRGRERPMVAASTVTAPAQPPPRPD